MNRQRNSHQSKQEYKINRRDKYKYKNISNVPTIDESNQRTVFNNIIELEN